MQLTDFAWAAGVIDGEGCFYAQTIKTTKAGNTYTYKYPSIVVGQSSKYGIPSLLLRLQELFGGNIGGPYHCKNRSPKYSWRIANFETVQQLLIFVWPWLGPVKREQAKNVLNICREFKQPEVPNRNIGKIRSEEFKRKVSEGMKKYKASLKH